jgi:hypothetical protein
MFASASLRFCTINKRSSIEFSITSLIVITGRVWPKRCWEGSQR